MVDRGSGDNWPPISVGQGTVSSNVSAIDFLCFVGQCRRAGETETLWFFRRLSRKGSDIGFEFGVKELNLNFLSLQLLEIINEK